MIGWPSARAWWTPTTGKKRKVSQRRTKFDGSLIFISSAALVSLFILRALLQPQSGSNETISIPAPPEPRATSQQPTSDSPSMHIDQVFVINLRSRPDRRAHMTAELRAQGLLDKTEFIEAVTPATMGSHLRGMPGWENKSASWEWYNVPLRDTELALTMSHHKIWQRVMERRLARALVLEDDVQFSEQFSREFGRFVAALPVDWHLLYLKHNCPPYSVPLALKTLKLSKRDLYSEGYEQVVEALKASGAGFLCEEGDEWGRAVARDVPVNDLIAKVGFSFLTMAYVLNWEGARRMVDAFDEQNVITADEFLPALYTRHPRKVVRDVYGNGDRMVAYGTTPDLVYSVNKLATISNVASYNDREYVDPATGLSTQTLEDKSDSVTTQQMPQYAHPTNHRQNPPTSNPRVA